MQITSEKVSIIQQRLKTVFSRHKSYAKSKRKDVSFSAGDLVFLKVSPMKKVMKFGKKGKLAPRYIGPFEVQLRIGEVVYRLVLPPVLSRIHPVFHVSILRKYISNPSQVLQPQTVELSEGLIHEGYPIEIEDQQVSQLRTKDVPIVKILWSNHTTDDYTWEYAGGLGLPFPV